MKDPIYKKTLRDILREMFENETGKCFHDDEYTDWLEDEIIFTFLKIQEDGSKFSDSLHP